MADFSYQQIPAASTPAPAPGPAPTRSRFSLPALPRPSRALLLTCLLLSATLFFTSNLLPPIIVTAPDPPATHRMYYPAPDAHFPPRRFATPPIPHHHIHPAVDRMHPPYPVRHHSPRYPTAYDMYETENMPMNPRVEQELLRTRLEMHARHPVAAPPGLVLPGARMN